MASVEMSETYPAEVRARNRWVLARRGVRNLLDPWIPYAQMWEEEMGPLGDALVSTATIFLTNRECPYRCVMCDLWQNTLTEHVPPGAIPAQIRHALDRLPASRQVKLYNAGSFFDPKAIPVGDYAAIAEQVSGFERVIVECHPAFLGEQCLHFRNLIAGRLEVAVGLETAHPDVLGRLNKRITVDIFRHAASFLMREDIALRVFILVRPPFLSEIEGLEWAKRSLDLAFECGASVCCLIPTRGGNGAMEALAAQGQFTPPSLNSMEAAQEYGLSLRRGRVFGDLWDVERFYSCVCSPVRAERIALMNQTQTIPPPVFCESACGGYFT